VLRFDSFDFNEDALLDQDVVLEGFFAWKLFIPEYGGNRGIAPPFSLFARVQSIPAALIELSTKIGRLLGFPTNVWARHNHVAVAIHSWHFCYHCVLQVHRMLP
jgi:hypothetical protein